MGKIPVEDLAQLMGVGKQDLVFKLRSIGVRVDEDHAHIDTSVLQAILKGKQLAQPREVILRDAEAKQTTPPPRHPGLRRPAPPGPARPRGRRRPMIHRVEPRIKTIPKTEVAKPAVPPATASPGASEAAPAAEAAEAQPAVAGTAPVATTVDAEATTAQPTAPTVTAQPEPPRDARRQRRASRRLKDAGSSTMTFKEAAPSEAVMLSEGMTVRDFADKLGVKVKELIKHLLERGMMVNINSILEPDTATEIAESIGVESLAVTFEEELRIQEDRSREGEASETEETRPPIVTIMGHVDHGKTTLLDTIRSARVTEGEAGGITQHIGAYQTLCGDRKITFLDTPGHEAFTLMRARGARSTDIVVLVVAADDGVMPQTIEAINHAKAAEVPILVAINKIDKANAKTDRVKQELSEHDLMVEDWGGDTVAVEISALKNEGVKELLEMILLTADMLDLKADPDLPVQGAVLEARKEPGRGNVATVLVQKGTLEIGSVFVAGASWGRVRSMMSDTGERLTESPPSTPVEVSGFQDLPEAGSPFQVLEDESQARRMAQFRKQEKRRQELAPSAAKVSLDQLFEQIQEGEIKELALVIKGDVKGSVEVLKDALTKLSTPKVEVRIIHADVGAITTNDVLLASASNALIVGFNVRPEKKAVELASSERVEIRLHTVIYELRDELVQAMTGLLDPIYREVASGRAEVRELFSIPKIGTIAGCHVVEGVIARNASVRLVRDNIVVHEGKLGSLRRFKDDASEVRSGFDCGIRLERYQDLKPGDMIEAYIHEEVAATL